MSRSGVRPIGVAVTVVLLTIASSPSLSQTATKLADGSIEYKCPDGKRIVKKPAPDLSEEITFPNGTNKTELHSNGDMAEATKVFRLPPVDLNETAKQRCDQSD